MKNEKTVKNARKNNVYEMKVVASKAIADADEGAKRNNSHTLGQKLTVMSAKPHVAKGCG